MTWAIPKGRLYKMFDSLKFNNELKSLHTKDFTDNFIKFDANFWKA